MTARSAKAAGEGERNGEGLRGSPMNASARVGLANIMARKRPEAPSIQQKRRLRMLESAIESSERPMAVVGWKPSGKSRLRRG